MKKLLSLLSVLTISGTAVPTTIAASPYQKEETIKNNDIVYQQINNLEKLNRSKRENNTNQELPIKNVGNWNLTTGQGYFKYLGWVVAYKQGIFKNYSELAGVSASNWEYNVDLENLDIWYDKTKTVSNEGFIDRIEKDNDNDFQFDNQLLDSSKNKLINNSNSTQKMLTSGYSHSVTKGRKVTNSFKITAKVTAKILKDIFSFEYNNSNEWSEQSTDTLTAPPQSVDVPANSFIEVNYKLFKNKKIVKNSIIWQEISPDQNYVVSLWTPYAWEGSTTSTWKWYNNKLKDWIKLIKENNLNWVLNIPNGFLKEKEDGKIVGRIAGLSDYESLESYYEVIISPPVKLN